MKKSLQDSRATSLESDRCLDSDDLQPKRPVETTANGAFQHRFLISSPHRSFESISPGCCGNLEQEIRNHSIQGIPVAINATLSGLMRFLNPLLREQIGQLPTRSSQCARFLLFTAPLPPLHVFERRQNISSSLPCNQDRGCRVSSYASGKMKKTPLRQSHAVSRLFRRSIP